jgi:hypothetical protein
MAKSIKKRGTGKIKINRQNAVKRNKQTQANFLVLKQLSF